ncbi:MAG TPA: hypothetical protein VII61_01970, partial [Ktedonobacteraceae bacterium]
MWGIKILQSWQSRVPIRWRLIIVSLGLLTLLLSVLGVVILFAAEQALDLNEANALWSEAILVMKSVNEHQRKYPLAFARSPVLFPSAPVSPGLLLAAKTLAQKLDGPRSETAILSPDGVVIPSTYDTSFVLPSVT